MVLLVVVLLDAPIFVLLSLQHYVLCSVMDGLVGKPTVQSICVSAVCFDLRQVLKWRRERVSEQASKRERQPGSRAAH